MTRQRSIEGMGDLFLVHEAVAEPREASPQLSDQHQRELAADVSRSCIVEAPAGSGKTGLLIQRYLKLLTLDEVQQPEQVLAITFTLKAAGEIRERVVSQLEAAAAAPSRDEPTGFASELLHLATRVLERDRALRWGLLENPRRMNLRTIDSICHEIARSLPVLSGGSGLAPVEDASSLHRLAAERTLLQLGGPDQRLSNALSLILLHRDGDLQRCQSLIAEMLSLRDQWGRLLPLAHALDEDLLDREVLPRLERSLAEAIREELSAIRHALPTSWLDRLMRLFDEMSYEPGYQDRPSPLLVCRERRSAPGDSLDDLPVWRVLPDLLLTGADAWRAKFNSNHIGAVATKPQREELGYLVDEAATIPGALAALKRIRRLPSPIYPAQQWRVAKALFVVLHAALVELQLVFAERGECDFTELGLLARSALRHESTALEAALGARLQHILVDEMQDTSTTQYELIELLTQGWDGRSQTVFLVGDPKQSIYLFRQARVERFLRMMTELRIGEIHLDLLELRSNFRSSQELVEGFNQTFRSIFPATLSLCSRNEVPYSAAAPARPPANHAPSAIHWHPQVLPAKSQDETSLDAAWFARAEAQSIREQIEAWRQRPLPEGKSRWSIAVLVRGRSHLAPIVAELRSQNGSGTIPFRAIDIERLGERREVLDLVALTRALQHPADRVAWLAVLRAPWCGLELADLHLLCGEDNPAWETRTVMELIAERHILLSPQGRARLLAVASVLEAAQSQTARLSLPEVVERTWKTLGGHASLTPEQRRNAEQYLSLLDELDRQQMLDRPDVLSRELNSLYAAPSADPDAIDLMTIHGAKGLEWDLVLLPGLERKPHSDQSRLLEWEEISSEESGESSVILAPIIGKGEDSQELNSWLRHLHLQREIAECARLFYVACTRAREELHLFATLRRRADGSLQPGAATLLGAAWPAAQQHFVDVQQPARPLIVPVVPFPPRDAGPVLVQLAAAGEARPSFSSLQRLVKIHAAPAPPLPSAIAAAVPRPLFERPDGSLEARAFGSTVHALLEVLARRLAEGAALTDLAQQVRGWQPRIQAILRGFGLSPASVQRSIPIVQRALSNTLNDPAGQWILGARADAHSEHALVQWDEERSSVRMDRIFRAGAEALAPGEDHLWIIDFKTSSPQQAALEGFLLEERAKYTPQMEAYAQVLRSAGVEQPIRFGLYHPLVPRLTCWRPGES